MHTCTVHLIRVCDWRNCSFFLATLRYSQTTYTCWWQVNPSMTAAVIHAQRCCDELSWRRAPVYTIKFRYTPFTRYNRLSNQLYNRLYNRFDNRFDNRLYRVNGAIQWAYNGRRRGEGGAEQRVINVRDIPSRLFIPLTGYKPRSLWALHAQHGRRMFGCTVNSENIVLVDICQFLNRF